MLNFWNRLNVGAKQVARESRTLVDWSDGRNQDFVGSCELWQILVIDERDWAGREAVRSVITELEHCGTKAGGNWPARITCSACNRMASGA